MLKKTMLLALLGASAAMIALPAAASAGTPTVDPGGTSFSGTFGTTNFGAQGEPTFTCEGANYITGSFNSAGLGGSATGGTLSLDFTNCHIFIFGSKSTCHSTGAPKEDTIALDSLPFDLTYATDAKTKPAILITDVETEIDCLFLPTKLTGALMGTVTAPTCGEIWKTAPIVFTATNNVQTHRQITGTGETFDLTAETTGGSKGTTGLNMHTAITLSEGEQAALTCL